MSIILLLRAMPNPPMHPIDTTYGRPLAHLLSMFCAYLLNQCNVFSKGVPEIYILTDLDYLPIQ
jgi:hypothetical protein